MACHDGSREIPLPVEVLHHVIHLKCRRKRVFGAPAGCFSGFLPLLQFFGSSSGDWEGKWPADAPPGADWCRGAKRQISTSRNIHLSFSLLWEKDGEAEVFRTLGGEIRVVSHLAHREASDGGDDEAGVAHLPISADDPSWSLPEGECRLLPPP